MKKILLPILILLIIAIIPVYGFAEDETNSSEDTLNVENNSENTLEATLEAELTQKTDFSNAKYELIKDAVSSAKVEISGVQPLDNHAYYLYITSSRTSYPEKSSNDYTVLSYDSQTKKFTGIGLAKKVELNQDLYAFIYEKDNTTLAGQYVVEGIKLERFEEPRYNDAFTVTHITKTSDQIVTKFTHDSSNVRNITVKIGKITDSNILKKIKDNNSSGMSDLLSYAKSASSIINESTTLTKKSFIQYLSSDGEKLISMNNIEDKSYYYLYVVADTENGKYITQEAVTLALSSKYSDGSWYMFFYGENDFNWTSISGNTATNPTPTPTPADNTTANTVLPNTGKGLILITILAILTASSAVLYDINKKYEGI